MNGVPGALQNRDPACRARQVNSRHIARCAATRLHGACGLPRTAGQLPPYCPLCRDSLAWRLRAHTQRRSTPAIFCRQRYFNTLFY